MSKLKNVQFYIAVELSKVAKLNLLYLMVRFNAFIIFLILFFMLVVNL